MKLPAIILLALAAVSFFTWQGCYYDNEEYLYGPPAPIPACDTLNVSYQNDVVAILDVRGCLGCHNNSLASGSINLQGHSNVLVQVNNGKLMGSIRHERGFSNMPQGGPKIPEEEIQRINCWIEQGAMEN